MTYHPTTRVLTVLELLQAHPQLSGPELAKRLEVHPRTVRRYITMLQDLGIPVETLRGTHGGYRLRPGFKLPPLMLTNDEALAITLSLQAANRQGEARQRVATAGALAKIERVLPDQLRAQLQTISTSVAQPPPVPTPWPDSTIFLTLSAAITPACTVQITYQDGQGDTTERRFDPYGLVQHWDRWYAVGWCHLRQAIRTFRLDRIRRVQRTDQPFRRPAAFDSLHHVVTSLALVPRRWLVEVILATTMAHVQRCITPGIALLMPDPEGILLRAYYDALRVAAHEIVLLDCPFRVLQPPELRDELRQLATAVLRSTE